MDAIPSHPEPFLSLHFLSTALGSLRTMRNITLITLLGTLFTTVLGDSLYQRANQEPLLSLLDSTKVPGKSPVEICSLSPSDDLVNIMYINLTPNSPLAGQNLTIEAMGYLKTHVEEGAYANFEVKYGFIKLLSGTADLCEKAAEVDLECPLEKGQVKVQKVVALPSQIPPVIPLLAKYFGIRLTFVKGKYQVTANIFTAKDELITCLTATVFFKVVRP
jgi:hypothetical protein